MTKFKKSLLQCNEFASTIMDSITENLNSRNYDFTSSKSEIVIKNSNKEEIQENIKNNINPSLFDLLIQVSNTKSNVFIRQKFV